MYMPRPPTPLEEYNIPTGRSKKSPNNRERIGFMLGLQEPLPFGLGFLLRLLAGSESLGSLLHVQLALYGAILYPHTR